MEKSLQVPISTYNLRFCECQCTLLKFRGCQAALALMLTQARWLYKNFELIGPLNRDKGSESISPHFVITEAKIQLCTKLKVIDRAGQLADSSSANQHLTKELRALVYKKVRTLAYKKSEFLDAA
jgi:hypothetical protein